MKSQEFKMPIFGVGPIYVITCLILTIAGIWLHLNGYIYQGKMIKGKIFFIIAGIFMILLGIYLWIQAVIVQKINKKVTEKKVDNNRSIQHSKKSCLFSIYIYIHRSTFIYSKLYFANTSICILGFFNNINEKYRRKMVKK